jgi:hypothetical protein
MHDQQDYQRKNPFTVPVGYFDTLADRVARRARKNALAGRPSRRPLPFLARLTACVAVIALVVLAARWAYTGTKPASSIPALDATFNPTPEEILEYLASESTLATLSNDLIE